MSGVKHHGAISRFFLRWRPPRIPAIVELFNPTTLEAEEDAGLIHMKSSANYHQDFWLLDLATMEDRQLTQLDDAGTINTFDIAPDGTRIVFDRLRDESDIVLIDLAEN